MRRVWQVGLAAVAASAALAGGVAAATGHDNGHPGKKGGHHERLVFTGPVQDIVSVNVGDPAAGPGDYAVFRYDVFTIGKNPTKVGDAYVNCVTQFPAGGIAVPGRHAARGARRHHLPGTGPPGPERGLHARHHRWHGGFRTVRGELLIQALSRPR